jgi:hypothetical protein
MAGGKITALLQTFGLSVGSCGFANVLQYALAVGANPNAPLKAQTGWAKKLKNLVTGFPVAQILFCIYKFIVQVNSKSSVGAFFLAFC